MPIPTEAYACVRSTEALKPYSIERRDVGTTDVHIEIKFCGVCHSDLHQAKNEWDGCIFPMVPGHEIVGIVRGVGTEVKRFKVGDLAAVGCYVDSCRTCDQCLANEEQHCPKSIATYNCRDYDGMPTYGGYSRNIVVTDRFVCKVPDALKNSLAGVAPLLCAGITTWTPIIRHQMNRRGKKIGVVGLGGLGHMAVKFAVAFECEVSVISSSENKRSQALDILKATHFIVSTDSKQMESAKGTLDFIIDCVSCPKNMNVYMSLLKTGGILVSVALPPVGFSFNLDPFSMIIERKGVYGSLVGGLKATQDMLDFCGAHNITSIVEVIKINEINHAYERMLKSDVRYRFVIDVDNSKFS